MPCHFKLEDVGSETGIEAEPEYRTLSKVERLEQTLYDLWLMMNETVSDSISAHLETKLRELNIKHNVSYGGEKIG